MKLEQRLHNEIVAESANIWYVANRSIAKIIVKLPTNVIKSIVKGCRVEFLFGRDEVKDEKYFHVGVRIYDDPVNFINVTSTLRFKDEHIALNKIMKQSKTLIEFYNELGHCVISSFVSFDKTMRENILQFQKNPKLLYNGDFDKAASTSLDCFDYSIDKARAFEICYEIETLIIPATFIDWQTSNIHFVGFNESNVIIIDDPDEGGILEKQMWAALDSVFFDLYKNPSIGQGAAKREFIDILAYYDLGIFLIECKSLSVFLYDNDKPMLRKVSSLQNHIKKAMKQVIGAKKSLDSDVDIFDVKGQLLTLKRNIVPHCIVVVSEMFPFGDWTEIQNEMFKIMKKENVYLHILDFPELITMLKGSEGRKEYFDFFLMERAEAIIKAQDLFARPKFDKH